MPFSEKVQVRAEILGMREVYADLAKWKQRVAAIQKQMRAAGETKMAKDANAWYLNNKYVAQIRQARAARSNYPMYSVMGAWSNNRANSRVYNTLSNNTPRDFGALSAPFMGAGRGIKQQMQDMGPIMKNYRTAWKRMEDQTINISKRAARSRTLNLRKNLRDQVHADQKAKAEQAEAEAKLTAKIKKENDKRQKEADETARKVKSVAKDAFATGFSFHILSMYVAPVVYGINRIAQATVQAYAKFDKLFADYSAKSEEYARQLSKSDFYAIASGQTYALNDAAQTAERFAASGLDVTKNQEALTKALQVGTIAGIGYDEAANGIIRTMQAMHLEVEQTSMITDAMINAANASTAELKDLVGWFEYAASSAYNAGLGVQDLSAMLGILSSTGLPNTGTAARQMFLQFSKADIREKFMQHFDWITEDHFHDFQKLVDGLREYVQAADDQSEAALEVTRLLGGKVTAQTALNNLLTAEPELWNQVTNAVKKTGTTQDLYNKVTNNTEDALKRIANSFTIIKAQIGEFIKPTVMILDKVFETVASAMAAIPGPLRSLIGGFVIAGAVIGSLSLVVMTFIGSLAIMQGITKLLHVNTLSLSFTMENYRRTVRDLWMEIKVATSAQNMYATSMGYTNIITKEQIVGMQAQTTATNQMSTAMSRAKWAMGGLMGASLGYMAASSAMQNSMYTEAHAVSMLTAAWIGLSVAKAGAGNPLALVAGASAGIAYEAMMYDKIEEQRRQANIAAARQYASESVVTNNYNAHIGTVEISSEGELMEEFQSQLEY